ncbi:MAG: winged helix-turn-helix transcriptional regulator [Bacteroides sp]|nr:winged helix-turn-helix transcriptional regulator [Bacteroides sp.]
MKPKFIIGIAIGIILLFLCTGLRQEKKYISSQVNHALLQSIDIDYQERHYKELKYSAGRPLGHKMKSVRIQGKDSIETIIFNDSLEEHVVKQLTNQYILSKINPIKPSNFNNIFKKELKELGITGKTGIIYFQENEAISSETDFSSIKDTVQTERVILDIKGTISILGWVSYDLSTYLKQATPMMYIAFFLILVLIIYFVFTIFHLSRNKFISHVSSISTIKKEKNENGIICPLHIDSEKMQVFIGNHILKTTPTTYTIFCLLAENPNTFVSRQNITDALWENTDAEDYSIKNRVDQNIHNLRSELKAFPEYQIISGRNKGFKLVTPEASEIPGT